MIQKATMMKGLEDSRRGNRPRIFHFPDCCITALGILQLSHHAMQPERGPPEDSHEVPRISCALSTVLLPSRKHLE